MLFFQIGSGSFAEFSYLASRDRKCYEKSQHPLARLPAPLSASSFWEGVLVEPHPHAFSSLYTTLHSTMPDAMQNLTFVLGAISIQDKPFMLFETTNPLALHGGMSRLDIIEEGYIKNPLLDSFEKAKFYVPTFTVCQMIEAFGEPDFVLLDVEGYELPILNAFLKISTCSVYQIESHSDESANLVDITLLDHHFDIVNRLDGMLHNRTEIQAVKRGFSL